MKLILLALIGISAVFSVGQAQQVATVEEVYDGRLAGSLSSNCSIQLIREQDSGVVQSVFVLSSIKFLEIPVRGDQDSVVKGKAQHLGQSKHEVVIAMEAGEPVSFEYHGRYNLAPSFPVYKHCMDLVRR